MIRTRMGPVPAGNVIPAVGAGKHQNWHSALALARMTPTQLGDRFVVRARRVTGTDTQEPAAASWMAASPDSPHNAVEPGRYSDLPARRTGCRAGRDCVRGANRSLRRRCRHRRHPLCRRRRQPPAGAQRSGLGASVRCRPARGHLGEGHPPAPAQPRREPPSQPCLWRIVFTRLGSDPRTRSYVARRLDEGRSRARDHPHPQALCRPGDLPAPPPLKGSAAAGLAQELPDPAPAMCPSIDLPTRRCTPIRHRLGLIRARPHRVAHHWSASTAGRTLTTHRSVDRRQRGRCLSIRRTRVHVTGARVEG